MQTKTDNSKIETKIKIRINNLPDKKSINVLDCFAGKSKLWYEIQKRIKKDITVLSIEKEKNKNLQAILGDNLKVIPNLDLNKFDVIDLDSYGIPTSQLDLLRKKNYKGIIFYTAIIIMNGSFSKKLVEANGVKYSQYKKCQTVFRPKFERFFNNYMLKMFVKRDIIYYKIAKDNGIKLYGVIKACIGAKKEKENVNNLHPVRKST